MRLKGRQARFLTVTIALWTALRLLQTWPEPASPSAAPLLAAAFLPGGDRLRGGEAAPAFAPWVAIPAHASAPGMRRFPPESDALLMLRTLGNGASGLSPHAILRHLVYASYAPGDDRDSAPADAAPPPFRLGARQRPDEAIDRRWSGETYLFVRPGSGRAAISPSGQLGGSQAAARLAYRIAPSAPVRIDAVARLYAPLASKGAEAAAGIDIRPFASAPLRLSIERRQRLDAAGRSAWSAYAAGGVYREDAKTGLVFEGYAQTGIVGLRRGDLFVDGALRAGKRIGGAAGPVLGVGLWGAAQPGVSRLDAGPRAAWRLPVADHGLTLAVEGRFRIAGAARPGSGVAVTLAADL